MGEGDKNQWWWGQGSVDEATSIDRTHDAAETNDANAKAGLDTSDASGKTTPSSGVHGAAANKADTPVKYGKWALAVAGAIVTLGGAVGVISGTTHWLSDIFGSPPAVTQLEVSPNLGISFHQNGQLDPMSANNQGVVSVSMKSEPFEFWFPTLATREGLEVCAATGSWIFTDAAKTGNSKAPTCLTPGMGVAEGAHGGGALVLASPSQPVSTAIADERSLPAGSGYEKYYVSNLADQSRIYLVAYQYTWGTQPNSVSPFNSQNVEDFILNIG